MKNNLIQPNNLGLSIHKFFPRQYSILVRCLSRVNRDCQALSEIDVLFVQAREADKLVSILWSRGKENIPIAGVQLNRGIY